MFSFLGLVLCVSYMVTTKKIARNLLPLHLYLGYGLITLALSISDIEKTGAYLSLRTMPIWYSAFAFFLANFCLSGIGVNQFLRPNFFIRAISWIALFITEFRLSPQVFFAMTSGSKFSIFLALMLFFLVAKLSSTTVTAILITLIFWIWVNVRSARWISKKSIIFTLALCALASLYFMKPLLETFIAVGYSDSLSGDANAIWRLMLWIYLFNEKFLSSPILGIGFGTPLFELGLAPSFITSDDGSRHTEFTLGAHNSFIFAAVRLGLVGFLLLLWIHFRLYSVATTTMRGLPNGIKRNAIISLILANLMFLNSALFNVVLESPLYAANYWFTLGIMYSICSRFQKEASAA